MHITLVRSMKHKRNRKKELFIQKKIMTKEKKSNFSSESIEELVGKCATLEDLQDIFFDLKRVVVEKALQGEMNFNLGYHKYNRSIWDNQRNGSYPKKVITEHGEMEISIPRDRNSSFEPQIIKKGQNRRMPKLDDQIISIYARGMSIKDIQSHLYEIYATDISTEFISNVTDSVLEEVIAWQDRPLDSVYPIMYLDAMQVKMKENNQIINKALYLAIGVNIQGVKEILGMWISKNEGAKF